MAASIISGTPDTFNVLAYGERHPDTVRFFEQQMMNVSSLAGQVSDRFLAQAKGLYERYSSEEARRNARAMIRAAKSIFQRDVIRDLNTMEEFQTAPPIMQRWVMSAPEIRELWQKQRIDGYSHSYYDPDPDSVGTDHYDYRRAMSDMIQFTDDGWKVESFYEPLLPGDGELYFEDKVIILNAWEQVTAMLEAAGEDPTSVFGDKLS